MKGEPIQSQDRYINKLFDKLRSKSKDSEGKTSQKHHLQVRDLVMQNKVGSTLPHRLTSRESKQVNKLEIDQSN